MIRQRPDSEHIIFADHANIFVAAIEPVTSSRATRPLRHGSSVFFKVVDIIIRVPVFFLNSTLLYFFKDFLQYYFHDTLARLFSVE